MSHHYTPTTSTPAHNATTITPSPDPDPQTTPHTIQTRIQALLDRNITTTPTTSTPDQHTTLLDLQTRLRALEDQSTTPHLDQQTTLLHILQTRVQALENRSTAEQGQINILSKRIDELTAQMRDMTDATKGLTAQVQKCNDAAASKGKGTGAEDGRLEIEEKGKEKKSQWASVRIVWPKVAQQGMW